MGQVQTAVVRVTVTQENSPVFGGPYTVQVDEKEPVGFQILQVSANKPGLTVSQPVSILLCFL